MRVKQPEKETHWTRVLALICSWYLTSISLHLYNKHLFSASRGAFPFPLFVTMIHMIVQGSLSYLSILFIWPRYRPSKAPSIRDFCLKVVPCGVATALDLGLSNASMKHITLSFYTMVKSASPVFVLLFAFLFGLERMNSKLIMSILVICLGVAIMVTAEADNHSKNSEAGVTPEFSWVGYMEVQAATILSGFRWALTQVLLKSQDIGMDNPLATNMFLSPIVASSLLFGFLIQEGVPSLISSSYFQSFGSGFGLCASIFGAGCLAFLMVNIEFGVISTTNVMTFSIAGIVKEILTIWTSQIVFGDKLEGNAGLGLAVSIFGIIGYNYTRILQSQEAKTEMYEEIDLSDFELDHLNDEPTADDLPYIDEDELDELVYSPRHADAALKDGDAFNLEARSVFLSWRTAKYPSDTRFLLVKAEIEPLRFEDVYEGCEPEKTVENLKPAHKYQFILKICHGTDALTIDELDLVTPDETAVQKSVFQLIRAVTEGDAARVAAIFREYRNQITVETNDRSGRSILMIACQRGDLDIVKTLLDRGANPLATTGSGKSPLSISVSEGHFLVIKAIILKEPTSISYADMNGTTLLMIAVEDVQLAIQKGHGIDIVKYLVHSGVNATSVDKNGFNALDRLCMSSGHLESAKFLISMGCTPTNSINKKSGMNQLMMAALNGHLELCKLLMDTHGLDPTIRTEHDGLAHLFAENAGHSKTAALVKKRYEDLHERARRDRAEHPNRGPNFVPQETPSVAPSVLNLTHINQS